MNLDLVIGTKGPVWYIVFSGGEAPLAPSQLAAIAVDQQNALPNVILRLVLTVVAIVVAVVVVALLVRMFVRRRRKRNAPVVERSPPDVR